MRAITLTQPWATLMAAGEKRIETRGWSPASLHMGEPVAIHAGKGLGEMDTYQFVRLCSREPFRGALVRAYKRGLIITQEPGTLMPRDLPRGAVVAVAEFCTAYWTSDEQCVRAVARSASLGAAHEREFGNYRLGRWAWCFVNVRPLREPITARGALGLWDWTPPDGWQDTLLAPVRSGGDAA